VSFFLAIYFSRGQISLSSRLIPPIVVATSLLGMTEIMQTFAFGRGIDLLLVGSGVWVGTVGAFSGVAFAEEH